MKIFDLIISRRTIHSFLSEEVSKPVLEKTVLAGIHAPNHRQTWPWRFYALERPTRLKLAELSVKFKLEKSPELNSENAKSSLIKNFMEHGALIVLGLKKTNNSDQAREDYAAMACAVQNMSLFLTSEGYGSKWGTGKITRAIETYNILGIDENEIEIVGFLWIGKIKILPQMPVRPPLEYFLTSL